MTVTYVQSMEGLANLGPLAFFGYLILGIGPGAVFFAFFIAPKSFLTLVALLRCGSMHDGHTHTWQPGPALVPLLECSQSRMLR